MNYQCLFVSGSKQIFAILQAQQSVRLFSNAQLENKPNIYWGCNPVTLHCLATFWLQYTLHAHQQTHQRVTLHLMLKLKLSPIYIRAVTLLHRLTTIQYKYTQVYTLLYTRKTSPIYTGAVTLLHRLTTIQYKYTLVYTLHSYKD